MAKSAPKRGTSKYGHRYNWRPDLPDQRDFLFSEKVAAPHAVPSSVDLRTRCSPIFNQGKIGSCTGNALAGAMEFLEKAELKDKDPGSEVYGSKFAHVSRLFIYYNERALEGTTGQDAGAQLRDGIKSLSGLGVCREATWKYSPSLVTQKPIAKAYTEARPHTISAYLRIQSLNEMKQCLAAGFPFAFGFSVYESLESPEVARTGVMPMPGSDERMLGGHAVLGVGYDDGSEQLIVRNSWGTGWGDQGYFRMPYQYLTTNGLARDFWTIRK